MTNKVLFIGDKRLCEQLAYVLGYPNYAWQPILQTTPEPDTEVLVAAFKRHGRRLVKITNVPVIYLNTICHRLDSGFYDAQPTDINTNTKAETNQKTQKSTTPIITTNIQTSEPFFKKTWRRLTHPVTTIKKIGIKTWYQIKKIYWCGVRFYWHCRHIWSKIFTQLTLAFSFHPAKREWWFAYKIQRKKPSKLLLYVLNSPLRPEISCRKMETRCYVYDNKIQACCCASHSSSLHQHQLSADIATVYNSTYARIIKLSSLNGSYCLCPRYTRACNFHRIPPQTKSINSPIIPEFMEIAIDPTCNLSCKSCRRQHYNHNNNPERFTTTKNCLLNSGLLDKVSFLQFAGCGEVFYSRFDRELLFDPTRKRSQINILSNGTLFDQENWDRLYQQYKDIEIRISVDAATAVTYRKIRGSNWDILMENLQRLSHLRQIGKIRFLRLNFVVQADNYREMPDFVRLGQKLGVDCVTFRPFQFWPGTSFSYYRRHCLIVRCHHVTYPLYRVLQDPILKNPEVDLRWLSPYFQKVHKSYQRRYAREHHKKQA